MQRLSFIRRPQSTNMKKLLLILIITAGLFGPRAAQAETSTSTIRASLLVQPAILELHGKPGEKLTAKVAITNQTDKPVPVKTVMSKLDLQDDGQTGARDIFDASHWFKIIDPDYILQPGQQRDISLEVNLPIKAEPGGHYATIFFEPLLPYEALATDATQATARIGALAFVTVAGEQKTSASLTPVLATKAFRQFGPIDFNFGIKNDGNTHLLPGGQLGIYDSHGRLVEEISLPPGIVLPHTTRLFSLQWNKRFLFGKYTAKLQLSYGSEHKPLLSQVSFWVAPGIIVGLALAVLVAAIYLAFRTRGRWGRALRVLRSRSEQ